MFVVVGRFRFRPMGQDERQSMIQRWEQDFAPIARESPGFRGVHFVRLSDDEVMTDWHWDSEADWDAARSGSDLSCNNTSSRTWLSLLSALTPSGRRYHVCFGTGTNLRVLDVWDSQETFNAFAQTLMPIIQQVGVEPPQPEISDVHNIIAG